MPPIYQDPLSAVPGAWRWVDLARAAVEVSSEAWAIAIIALAVYSFLEAEVKGVLKAFLPLLIALGAAALGVLAARSLGGVPRPAADAGSALGPLLARAFPSDRMTAVAVFSTYTALVYRRRAIPVVALAVLLGLAHALLGPHWAADLAGGALLGLVLGALAYLLTLRVVPKGHVASCRLARPTRSARPAPGSP